MMLLLALLLYSCTELEFAFIVYSYIQYATFGLDYHVGPELAALDESALRAGAS